MYAGMRSSAAIRGSGWFATLKVQANTGLLRSPTARALATADRFQQERHRLRAIDWRVHDDQAVDFGEARAVTMACSYAAAPAEATRSTGLPNSRARQFCASAVRVSVLNGGTTRPAALASISGKNTRSAGVGDDPDTRADRERLEIQALRDVEHLVDGVGTDDPGLLEEGIDGRFIRGEPRRMTAGRTAAGRCSPRLDNHDRLLSTDAPGELGKASRIAERLQIEQEHRRLRIALAPLQEIVP